MKKFIKNLSIAGLMASAIFVSSCDTEDPISSSVTNYALITLEGDNLIVLTQGDTYTEPGGQALEAGVEIPLEISGDVDTSTPGVYDIYYSAINADGFPSEQRRTVIVLSSEPSAINLEGTFFRNGNANNVSRISDRVYQADNAGGVAPADPANVDNLLNVTFYNIDDVQIYIPYQEDVSVTGIDVESNIGTIVSENEFTWVLTASAFYGTATRVFTR